MTQTDNMHLNIWTPDDTVNVAEINSNFETLDDTYAAMLRTQQELQARMPKKLLDVTSQSDVNQWDVDLKGLDLGAYDWIDVYATLLGIYNYPVFMRVNNNTDRDYLMEFASGSHASFKNLMGSNAYTTFNHLRFYNLPGALLGYQEVRQNATTVARAFEGSIAMNNVQYQNLQTLSFFFEDNQDKIKKGSRIIIVGEKAW